MKRIVIFFIACILCISDCSVSKVFATESNSDTVTTSFEWPSGPSVNAEAAILMDVSSGLVLYEKNAHTKHYPASITKIMTTLLCIENSSLSETVTFSENAIYNLEEGSSHIGIDVGEELTMEQCLYAIMLASANEVSSGVAEHVGGTVSGFAEMMTSKASDLGCQNTNFVNANGLHDDNHYTTVYDMALIGRAAMQYSTFRKIIGTKVYTIPPTNKHDVDNVFSNHHQMLHGYKYPQYKYEYCLGGKTGYTTKSGNTLVTFAEKDGVELVCVVMRAQSVSYDENQYTDTIKLFDFGFENYTSHHINDNFAAEDKNIESPLFTKFNSIFDTASPSFQIGKDTNVLLPNGVSIEEIERHVAFYDDVTVQLGENIVGSVSYTYDGKTVGCSDIIYHKTEKPAIAIPQNIKEVEDNTILVSAERADLKPLIISVILIIIGLFSFLYWWFFVYKRRRRKIRF